MNTVADIEFKVKGKTVSSDPKKISALPEDERRKAFARMKALGSAVAGFSNMETPKMPPTVMPTMAARDRSPSPKPVMKEEPKKEETKKPVPPRMPRGIADDLIKDYESHEYNRGLGYPLKSITSHIDRLLNEGIFKPKFPHKEYLNSLKKYLNDVAFDATWRGEPQKVVLASDWDAAFKK
jgi:hypothetical protein